MVLNRSWPAVSQICHASEGERVLGWVSWPVPRRASPRVLLCHWRPPSHLQLDALALDTVQVKCKSRVMS